MYSFLYNSDSFLKFKLQFSRREEAKRSNDYGQKTAEESRHNGASAKQNGTRSEPIWYLKNSILKNFHFFFGILNLIISKVGTSEMNDRKWEVFDGIVNQFASI